MNKRQRKIVKRLVKEGGGRRAKSWVHGTINRRAELLTAFRRFQEDGKIVVVREGMDCDCVSYFSARTIDVPVSVLAWDKEEDEHHAWLDGPESASFARPSDYPKDEYHSRDNVMEAYEDGHPNSVQWGDPREGRSL